MNGRKSKLKIIGVDTNIFTYLLTQDSLFHGQAEKFFETITNKGGKITTTVLTLTELLALKAPGNVLSQLETELLSIPNLELISVNIHIALEAAKIRRKYNFRTPDAIQLATAQVSKAQVFVTNDRRLKSFKEVKVVLLKDISRILK